MGVLRSSTDDDEAEEAAAEEEEEERECDAPTHAKSALAIRAGDCVASIGQ